MIDRKIQLAGLIVALAAIGILITVNPAKKPRPLTTAQIASVDRTKADRLYNSPQGKEAYKSFVDKWKVSPDKKVQDEVGAARIRLGYLAAKDKNWSAARAQFKEAVSEYKGTGSMAADFGGVRDEALYQSAVTLNAEGQKAEYRKALIDFIRSEPLSPLVHAAYKRIVKLDGRATQGVDALLQHALDQQQERTRFETSVCGPRALAYLLKAEGKGEFDYKELAKECGTNDKGTTLEAMRVCLRSHGLFYYGFRVSKSDLRKIECPAVLFQGDHYLIVTKAGSEALTAFDPSFDRARVIPLSSITDPQFNAILLLKSAPSTEAN
jgi:hypothetical protein